MIDLVRLLEDMAKSLVENPDAVAVTQEIDGDNNPSVSFADTTPGLAAQVLHRGGLA